jgi:hypothetical protein
MIDHARSGHVVGQAGPSAKRAERSKDGVEAAPGEALSERMVTREGGRGVFVVPERDHHGAPKTRRVLAREWNRGGRVEPPQPGDRRGCWSVAQRSQRAPDAKVGDVDGRDHRDALGSVCGLGLLAMKVPPRVHVRP